ncbi:hypothetical protein HK105_201193 [Polyrhizophydium stewartii]|uniref:histidine kinase n=1 Tax=Polyrhizophydium stewartii TaxID=2732419 RepID=A0ABR4NJB3_9FUNG
MRASATPRAPGAAAADDRLRLVIEIQLADSLRPPRLPARSLFAVAGPGGRDVTLPTLATGFHASPSRLMRVLGEIETALQALPTVEQRLVFMAQAVRRMIRWDTASVFMLGDEMDMTLLYEEEDPDCEHKLLDRIGPTYRASKFVVSRARWTRGITFSWPRFDEDVAAAPAAIQAERPCEALPLAKCILRPLLKFQTDFFLHTSSSSFLSLHLIVMGRVMIAINFRCAKPTSLPFSCLPLLNALTWTFSQSIECCIMADQIRSELVLANQMLELLGTEIGQEESFVPYAPELVRKSGVERLARCVSGLLAIISVDAAIVCLGSDLEIVQPGTDEEEIRRIAAFLRSKHFAHMHVSRCCERDFPDAVRIGPDGEKHSIFFNIAGILLVPLSKCGHSFIALLRRQEIQFATSLRINDFTDEFEVTDTKQQSCREWSPREQNMAKLLQVVFWSFVGSLQQREDGLRNEHLKTMLLANISHEVRTPLNAIVNFLEMMLDDPGSDSFQALWKLALDASRSVVHIISELLLVTETGWGAVQMRREPFRIMDCIRSCAGMFPAACKNRGLRFSLVMNESNRDAVVIGDQGKLRQVLTNLLGNAVKYTERGFVELRVESQVLDNSTLEVTLSVRDSGMGIPESKLGAIFDAFERITDVGDKRSEIEGAGLGLSICAKLASLMNGSLTVESTENVGSTFTFVVRLPLSEPEPRSLTDSLAATALSSQRSSLPPLSIAIAEDNVANQRVVVLRLARDGHTTHVFDNGRALIDFVTSPEHPRVDLALVDLDMPGMLGVEVVHLIREAEANTGMPRIPVVAITASVSLADRDECIRAGMDGFLGKPLDFGVLRRMLNDIADGSWLQPPDVVLAKTDWTPQISKYRRYPCARAHIVTQSDRQ